MGAKYLHAAYVDERLSWEHGHVGGHLGDLSGFMSNHVRRRYGNVTVFWRFFFVARDMDELRQTLLLHLNGTDTIMASRQPDPGVSWRGLLLVGKAGHPEQLTLHSYLL